ncbi:COP23 domain-containing protein [Almyronema epifaneia]|uniref:COP23 domain-containing protein n=1 Tax=Almyronema epifaneia S1 TaxID=2991925 RepID=A0ABW6IFJ2_9CYAN
MTPQTLRFAQSPHRILRSGLFALLATVGMLLPAQAQTTEPQNEPAADSSPRFQCQLNNGQYTVMYRPSTQPEQTYPWAVPEAMGDNWPAERRCDVISERLEFYRPDGLLELRTDRLNGYDIVCVTTEQDNSCRIVFTVPPGQNAVLTRDRVFENLVAADQGQATEGINTFAGNNSDILGQIEAVLGGSGLNRRRSSGINLQPFLDEVDGGTGTQLRPSTLTPGRRLNPGNF